MNKTLKSRYQHIKERCYNPKSKSYKRYGGRGIKMADCWLNNYQAFENWCLSHGFEEGLAIDRIDNDGDYSPENCRFVTLKENNQKRCTTKYYTIDGVTKNLQQWCDTYGVKRGTVYTRLQHGWSIEDALSTPVKHFEFNKNDYIGLRFGKLTIIDFVGDEEHYSYKESKWLCQCDCGKTKVVLYDKLKSGHTKSCGCMQSEKARERMLNDNPMKTDEQRLRMKNHNPMFKK